MRINMCENARYDHIVRIVSTNFKLAIMTGIYERYFYKIYSLDPPIVLLLLPNSAAESPLF